LNRGRVVTWLRHLYPPAWQERYGDEFDLLLEQCLHTPLDVLDVVLGALDAHLQLLSGEDLNWRILNMLNKLRTTLLIVFTAYIGFIVAGFSLVGLADDSLMIPLMQTDPALHIAWIAIQAGAAIALLAVVIGGLPLALTILRRALGGDRHGRRLLLVPAFAFLALVLYGGFIILVGTSRIQISGVVPVVQPGNFPPGNRIMLGGMMLVFVLGAIASTIAVWKAVSRTEVEQEPFRLGGHTLLVRIYSFARLPALITSLCMLTMLVATLVWGWLSFSALPQVLSGDFGPWQTSTRAWYFGILALMSLCTAAAFFGLWRGGSKIEAA
jgi:hypothetical protein